MLIYSQDRKVVVNFGQINAIGIYNNNRICVFNADGHVMHTLGVYTSEEMCQLVLGEIIDCYERSLYFTKSRDYAARADRPYIFAKNRVYRMPERKENP